MYSKGLGVQGILENHMEKTKENQNRDCAIWGLGGNMVWIGLLRKHECHL